MTTVEYTGLIHLDVSYQANKIASFPELGILLCTFLTDIATYHTLVCHRYANKQPQTTIKRKSFSKWQCLGLAAGDGHIDNTNYRSTGCYVGLDFVAQFFNKS